MSIPRFSGTFEECHSSIEKVNEHLIKKHLKNAKVHLVSGATLNHYDDYQWSPSKLGVYSDVIFDNEAFYKVWEYRTPWSNYFVFYIKKCEMHELIIEDGVVQTKEENEISKIDKRKKDIENKIGELRESISTLRKNLIDLNKEKKIIEKNQNKL